MPFSRAAAAACRPEPEAARKGTGMRVLLIEDDSATAQSIELMLKSESFNVYTTDLGEKGVDLGKLYDYDIIVLDLNLPDMSGYEVLRTRGRNQIGNGSSDRCLSRRFALERKTSRRRAIIPSKNAEVPRSSRTARGSSFSMGRVALLADVLWLVVLWLVVLLE